MFKQSHGSALLGCLKLLKPFQSAAISTKYGVKSISYGSAIGRLSTRAILASDCLRYPPHSISSGNSFTNYSCRKDFSLSVDGRISSRGYYQQGASVSAKTENHEDLGEWSESSDIPDEVFGDFKRYRLSQNLTEKLKAIGIQFLFPVQTSTFDLVYDGFDVIVQARTGSGKTLSYSIPLVEKLNSTATNTPGRPPKLLVMTPTRELARQVADVMESISDKLSVACVYGGAPLGPQESKIRSGIDVLVGTPGRIQDFLERRVLSLKSLSHVVLDEVDRMLDMGFMDSVDSILKERYISGQTSSNPQTLLFSATVPPWVQKTARKYLRPELKKLDLVGKGTIRTPKTVEHLAIECRYFNRNSVIANIIQVYSGDHGRSIVFCETKRDADRLATSGAIKQESHVLHGDIPQDKREMVLRGFRDGHYKCLIATDVAARGLDIPEVDLVIQCSPSKDVDSYIHRSGRTGRAGRNGISVLLYKYSEIEDLRSLEREAGFHFKKISAPTHSEVMLSMATDATKSLEKIPETTIEKFSVMAETLIAERGAVPALAAALAVISGAVDLKPRSLLTSQTGYTTYLFSTNSELYSLGAVWHSMKLQIPYEITKDVVGMRLCQDRMSCVFDLPSNYDSMIKDLWKDGEQDTLKVATELPKILDIPAKSRVTDNRSLRNRHTSNRSYDWPARSQAKSFGNRSSERFRPNPYRGLDFDEQ